MAEKGEMETLAVVLSWFVLNISMASSTKWIFMYGHICKQGEACVAYKFPLTITVIHMLFSWVMCRAYIYGVRGGKADLGLSQQARKVAPLSVCFALSVATGNLSLKYIYPSFNQMLGSISPLITVLLAMVLQRKRFNTWTWISMPVICGGLAVCSAKEANFHLLGAVYVTVATVLRGLKSLMQGKLLSSAEKMDSVTLLYYMSPWSAALLLVMALISEGSQPFALLISGMPLLPGDVVPATGILNVLFLLVVSGLNACLLNLANFLVTSYTSPVTLQVLGNVKSCISIGVSVAIFRNSLKLEQAVGVVTCLFGVWLYQKKGGAAEAPKVAHKEGGARDVELQLPEATKQVA